MNKKHKRAVCKEKGIKEQTQKIKMTKLVHMK